MPIISVKDKENNRWRRNAKKIKQNNGNGNYSKRVRDKWFCWAFKLGFLQLICEGSLIFTSNLELALSVILKERELYESTHVAVECRCLKIWDLLSFFICSSILVLKWRHVSPIWLELQLAQVTLYNRKEIIRNWVFLWKIIFNFQWSIN